MRLVLVRHGESEHGLRRMIAGPRGCLGLTERGIHQAQALAGRLRATGELNDCCALLSSPWRRARQTADVLADALPVEAVEDDPGLCELHPGEADGLSWEDYSARYGQFDLLTSPTRPFAPGGESWSDFLARVEGTLSRLAERFQGQAVVAVSHGGFVVASVLALFDIPRPGTGARLDAGHTSLTEWSFSEGTWRLTRFNDMAHLPPLV